MPEAPKAFVDELQNMLDALGSDTGLEGLTFEVLAGAYRAEFHGTVLLVPRTHVDHWNRFGVFPTALLRDAAYGAKRISLQRAGVGGPDLETDALAYAEGFLKLVGDEEE